MERGSSGTYTYINFLNVCFINTRSGYNGFQIQIPYRNRNGFMQIEREFERKQLLHAIHNSTLPIVSSMYLHICNHIIMYHLLVVLNGHSIFMFSCVGTQVQISTSIDKMLFLSKNLALFRMVHTYFLNCCRKRSIFQC